MTAPILAASFASASTGTADTKDKKEATKNPPNDILFIPESPIKDWFGS
jgi:hypothetical protein